MPLFDADWPEDYTGPWCDCNNPNAVHPLGHPVWCYRMTDLLAKAERMSADELTTAVHRAKAEHAALQDVLLRRATEAVVTAR